MNNVKLSEHVQLDRRYNRSINLERDLKNPDSVNGYVITPRSQDILERFIHSFKKGATRAWTITGVYGTGKSSIAHFLTALCSPKESSIFENALQVLRSMAVDPSAIEGALLESLPQSGLVPAVVTARREPIHHTIMRGLYQGLNAFYQDHKDPPPLLKTLQKYVLDTQEGRDFESEKIHLVIAQIRELTQTGILLIIDELGKNFEYSAQYSHQSDLYLLQELAEQSSGDSNQGVFVFGLLHQAFSEYARNMTGLQANEWAKIQGRFEDVAFAESQEQMFRLMGKCIRLDSSLLSHVANWSENWADTVNAFVKGANLSADVLAEIYPLHPLAALVLPQLCQRYAQNERSIFTFLASSEPHALQPFLANNTWNSEQLPTLKIHQVYDYFVESANMTASSRLQSQRWIEIHNRILDARYLNAEELQALKTIGLLNLVSLGGNLKASMQTTLSALSDYPVLAQSDAYQQGEVIIRSLMSKGFITYRESFDELRLWQGTDFNIENALQETQEQLSLNIVNVLNKHFEMLPLVAQKHSYQTGTLRYFERAFLGENPRVDDLLQPKSHADGFLYYVLGEAGELPANTLNGRPILYLEAQNTKAIFQLGLEYAALYELMHQAPQLRTDIVAKQEVEQRLTIAQRQLKEALHQTFSSHMSQAKVLLEQREIPLKSDAHLNRILSEVCDSVYSASLHLWNELLNREELTTQGSKARKTLVSAMIDNAGEENLGITGYGPERSMFESLLKQTGLYREEQGIFGFYTPFEHSGIFEVWRHIKTFCFEATDVPQSVDELFTQLKNPPYGAKSATLPVLLMAVLAQFGDEISLFQDGAFIPILHMSHFELLFRHPQRFAVKSFAITGLRADYFEILEEMLVTQKTKNLLAQTGSRNRTLLSLVQPLIGFSHKLPTYTQKTRTLSPTARALRKALLGTKDPEILVFHDIPQALGFDAIDAEVSVDLDFKRMQKELVQALQDMNQAYPELLNRCKVLLQSAFNIRADETLRQEVTRRAVLLKNKTVERKVTSFVNAALDQEKTDKAWLEALAMVISDKPLTEWSDQDLLVFETQLADLYRRFSNLEAIQHELNNLSEEGKQAKRVMVADTQGNEVNQVVWVTPEDEEKVSSLVDEILQIKELRDDPHLQRAFFAGLSERLFQV